MATTTKSPSGGAIPRSMASEDPAEILGRIMKPAEVQAELGITSQKVTSLYRRGVIRRFSSHFWGGYLREDVEKLKEVYDQFGLNSKEAKEGERKLSMAHLKEAIKKTTKEDLAEYRRQLDDASIPTGKLLQVLGNSDPREKASESKYQYLCLWEDETGAIETVLQSRRALVATSNTGLERFAVNRITLPPVEYWDRHKPIADMLIKAASEYYGVSFDVMDSDDYTPFHLANIKQAMLRHFNGARVESDMAVMVREAATNGEFIPLVYKAAYWYKSLRRLLSFGLFSPSRDKLVTEIYKQLTGLPEDAVSLQGLSETQELLDLSTGAQWADMYSPRWFPVYIGEPPYHDKGNSEECAMVGPKDKQWVSGADINSLPSKLRVGTKSQIEYQIIKEQEKLNEELQGKLANLHLSFLASTADMNGAKKEISAVGSFIKALGINGISPSMLFEKPFENAKQLIDNWDTITFALDSVFGVYSDEEIANRTKKLTAEAESVSQAPTAGADPAENEIEVTEQDREMMVLMFLREAGKDFDPDAEPSDLVAVMSKVEKDDLDKFILEQWGYESDV